MKKILIIIGIIMCSFFNVIEIQAYDEEFENQQKVYSLEEEYNIQQKVDEKIKFTKNKRSNRPMVIIDPGHGGKDSGALSRDKKYKEKDLNLDIALAAQSYLTSNGIDVIMTRSTDEWIELKERSMLSNSINPALFVSIHNDTSEGNGNGAHAIYSIDDINGGTSKDLANNILNSIAANTSQNKSSRGAWTRKGSDGKDWYHVIREVESPSVIVECSYMNPEDIKAVQTIEKRKVMGIAIAKGIVKTISQINPDYDKVGVDYVAHVEGIGWMPWVKDGELAGTEEQYKRLEALEIELRNAPRGAKIVYRGHVQGIGWMDWMKNGELVGTTEQAKRMEAIQIKLEGMPGYSVEYRTHVEGIGWMNWVRDGEISGTEEQYKRVEAIQIRLVRK